MNCRQKLFKDRNDNFMQCDRKTKRERMNEYMVDLFEVVEITNNE